jgi:hypothetical protein
MSKRSWAPYGLLLISLLALALVLIPAQPLKTSNPLRITIIDVSGTREYSHFNIITDIGERYERNALGFQNATVSRVNATNYISVGNATPATTLTKLTSEMTSGGFTRALGTVTSLYYSSDYSYNVTITFTASASFAVNSVGLHWNGTSNSDLNLYAVAYISDGTYHQFTVSSQLIIRWLIVRNAN